MSGPQDLRLFSGGLLERLALAIGWRETYPPPAVRAAAAVALCFLPVVVLSFVTGSSAVSALMHDVATLVRFLVVLPMLIMAEAPARRSTSIITRQFAEAGVVAPEGLERYTSMVARATRAASSVVVEAALLVTVVVLTASGSHVVATAVTTWQKGDGGVFTLAGQWNRWVGLPVYRFLIFRWLWRYAVWIGLLWSTSRLPLRLTASHPDGAGGLQFVSRGQRAFGALLFALSAQVAGRMAQDLLRNGVDPSTIFPAIGIAVVLAIALALVPQIFFSLPLINCRREGFHAYGGLGTNYTQSFETKWLGSGGESKEELLGTADIQSLADLANSFNIVRNIRVVPFDRSDMIALAASAATPFLPLLLLVYPIDELAKMVMKSLL